MDRHLSFGSSVCLSLSVAGDVSFLSGQTPGSSDRTLFFFFGVTIVDFCREPTPSVDLEILFMWLDGTRAQPPRRPKGFFLLLGNYYLTPPPVEPILLLWKRLLSRHQQTTLFFPWLRSSFVPVSRTGVPTLEKEDIVHTPRRTTCC